MSERVPVLLSFYALSNGTSAWLQGQLTTTSLKDYSFHEYSRRKTFRTILALYRTRVFANETIQLFFGDICVTTTTDGSGAFQVMSHEIPATGALTDVRIESGQSVKIVDELYNCSLHTVQAATILISDIDDTLLHSYISNKLLKFRTLLFTAVEDRKAVTEMMQVVNNFAAAGVAPFYLSNSEQNLYPIIYRFLRNNSFPKGPLFLKQLRKLRDIFRKRNLLTRDVHKLTTLDKLLKFFPDKKFVLVGDNTQNDMKIYLATAEKYPNNIERVIIRKAIVNKHETLFDAAAKKLATLNIKFHYDTHFPKGFDPISS